jgi:hypothetical protein
MKKLTFLGMLLFSMAFSRQAQSQINVNVNFGAQPAWGPVGYDRADYYYLPDIDAYYDVPQRKFIYMDGNRWVTANGLPARYSSYNLYNGYKVVINEPRPFERADIYRVKYAKYKGNRGQAVIRDSHDNRYKNNGPNYSGHQDNGNHKNKGKGKGKGHNKN